MTLSELCHLFVSFSIIANVVPTNQVFVAIFTDSRLKEVKAAKREKRQEEARQEVIHMFSFSFSCGHSS